MAARPKLCGAVESHGLLGVEAASQTVEVEREEKLWPGFGSQYRTALLGLFRQRLQLEPRHLLLCLGQDAAAVAAALRSAYNLRQPPVLWDKQQVQPPPCQRALLLHPTHDHHQNVIGLVRHIFSGLEILGEMLLVHRPGSMITLPFFEKARKKLAEEDYPYMEEVSDINSRYMHSARKYVMNKHISQEVILPYVIRSRSIIEWKVLECLSELGADVQWEIEHVPVITSKANWLSVVGRKGPPMPETLSPHEVERGLQELRHGCLRYIEDKEPVTFEDRLMFIRASKTVLPRTFPRICRGILMSPSPHASEQDVPLKLPLTEDLSRLLEKASERSNAR